MSVAQEVLSNRHSVVWPRHVMVTDHGTIRSTPHHHPRPLRRGGTPGGFDPLEPVRLARAVESMGLRHVVITSVDRDDLPNGGAEAFAGCVEEIRKRLPD